MGTHYIPRYYLKGFTESVNSEFIWTYEKGAQKEPFRTNIINIAQQTNYYSKKTEDYLAQYIEFSANDVIAKIRDEQPLNYKDKDILSTYMSVLLKRVPKGHQLAAEFHKDISNAYPESNGIKIDKTVEIQFLWETVLRPEMTPDIPIALKKMKWKFFVFDKEPIFLTSDNPISFPKALGLGNTNSELTFPISKNIALWAAWGDDIEEEYVTIDKETANYINQWTISTATKYIFFSKRSDWVINMIREFPNNI